MPNVAFTNITSGEFSPSFLGRADVARYPNGCQILENFFLTPTGMWMYRPGWRLMGFPKAGGAGVRLKRFKFSDQQAYILEFGHNYFRIWHTSGLVAVAGVPVEVATVFPASELTLLAFTQSADFLFVFHETRGIFAIKRTSHTSWSIAPFPLQDGPYRAQNTNTGLVVTIGANSGSVAVTFNSAVLANGDEGMALRVSADGTNWRWLKFDSISSATAGMATVQGAALDPSLVGANLYRYRLGLYSNRLGWPATGSLYEQRLVLAGAQAIPDRIDGSAIAAFDVFSPGVTNSDAWGFAIGTPEVNRILGLSPSNDLLAFTVGSEARLSGDSERTAITATTVSAKTISTYGSKRLAPLPIGTATLTVDKQGQRLRALQFDLGLQSYNSDDLMLLADHIAWLEPGSPGIQGFTWQQNPVGLIWVIRGNAELAACTWAPKEQVLGWHRHPMGKTGVDGEADPIIESIETMPGATYDEVWASVVRELPNGQVLRTIERLERAGLWDAPVESLLYLDCGQTLDNTQAAALTLAAVSGDGVRIDADLDVFDPADVGRFIKYRTRKGLTRRGRRIWHTAVAEIVEVLGPRAVRADILVDFPGTSVPANEWRLTVVEVSGLGHWEGCQVRAVSDGHVLAPKTVVAGKIGLEVPGGTVHIGQHYPGRMVSMPLDPGPSPAVGQGRPVRVDRLLARFLNSIGGMAGTLPETDEEPEQLERVYPWTVETVAPYAPPPAQSGDHELIPAGSWTRRAEVEIRQDVPLPLNVQLVVNHVYAPWGQP